MASFNKTILSNIKVDPNPNNNNQQVVEEKCKCIKLDYDLDSLNYVKISQVKQGAEKNVDSEMKVKRSVRDYQYGEIDENVDEDESISDNSGNTIDEPEEVQEDSVDTDTSEDENPQEDVEYGMIDEESEGDDSKKSHKVKV